MTDQQPSPQNTAREEILKAIGDTAKATASFNNQPNKATVLKDLAEAYAFVVSPNQPH